MPYQFPRRALAGTDVLDPVEMDADFQPAAEKYSGKLDGHDFDGAAVKASVAVASGAYFAIGHAFRSVAPGYAHFVQPPQAAGSGPDAVFTLLNDRSWHTVDDMIVSISTGTSVLWIIGWLQYSWFNWPHSSGVDTNLGAQVQFAISVDERIVPATITGKRENYEHLWAAARPLAQWNNATPTAFPGGGRVQVGGAAAGLGPHHSAVRIGCAHPVSPGTHSVRILARRVPRGDPREVFTTTDYIVVYSRRLFVLDGRQVPRSASSLSTVDVPAFEPEATLSATSMGTSRATAIRDAYNSVAAGAVSRGAFNNNHLPTSVRASDISQFGIAVSQTTDDTYPGYGVGTFAGAQTGAAGWWELNDGAGGNLRVTNGGSGWNRANGTIVVLGNVHVNGVITQRALPSGEFDHFGVITLGYNTTVGGNAVIGATEAGVNSYNLLEDGVAANRADRQIEADVPVFFVHEASDTVLPSGTINYFTLYGSTLNGAAMADRINMTWNTASLVCIQLRT